MKKILVLALFAAVAATAQAAELTLANWRYKKPIEVSAAKPVAAARLDAETLEGSRDDLRDLRIVTDSGEEVPYTLRTQAAFQKSKPLPTAVESRTNGETENTLTVRVTGESEDFNRVTLVPKTGNFKRRITIEGSADGVLWKVLRQDVPVFHFAVEGFYSYLRSYTHESYAGYGASYAQASDLSFRIPDAKYRWVRVTVPHDMDKEPVEIEDLKLSFGVESAADESAYEGAIISQTPDKTGKATEMLVDFGKSRLPIERLRVELAKNNFFRGVGVSGSDDGKEWKPLGSGSIYSIAIEGEPEEKLEIAIPESRFRYYKLSVHHGDNKPVPAVAVKGFGLARFAVFMPEAGKKHFLYYGHPGAKGPDYDTARLLSGRPVVEFARASLGAAQENPGWVYSSGKPWTEDHAWLIWIAMALVAAALVFLATRVIRGTD